MKGRLRGGGGDESWRNVGKRVGGLREGERKKPLSGETWKL